MEAIKDLVSVIIPTYNRAHLIKRSAMSVLNQTYSNLELIIVDDGSTDNTEEVVKSIDDNRVIYIKQSNQGACAARNNGIDHAKGEFIAFQDSDDVWHVDKLEKQLKCLNETGADFCFCSVKTSTSLGLKKKSKFVNDIKELFGIGVQRFFAYSYVFQEIKFDINMPRWQDLDVLLAIYERYSIFKMGDYLVDYYIQADSISKSTDKALIATNLLINKYKYFKKKRNYVLLLLSVFDTIYSNQIDLLSKIINYRNNILYLFIYKFGIYHMYRYFKNCIKHIIRFIS